MPLIEPDLRHRFSNRGIRKWHGTAETAFQRGDFMLAAEMAEAGSSLQFAAYVLAGLVEKGVAGLTSCSVLSDTERLILAFGLWLSDKPDEAKVALRKDFTADALRAAADELRHLVDGERATVLMTMDIYDHPIEDSLKIGQFLVQPVATQVDRGEADLRAGVDIAAHIAALPAQAKPAFVLTAFNHWVAPGGLDRLDVPCVRWHHDEDTQFQRSYDTYRIYDLNIVSTSMQHFELSNACRNFWVSNLFTHPNDVSYRMPTPGAKKRDLDIVMTGTTFDAYHSEKSRFIFSLARKLPPETRLVTVNGHLPADAYRDLSQRARFMPVINRVAGSPSPRWHETLESGAVLLYPEGTFYGHVSEGALPFDPDDPVAAIARYLSQSDSTLPDPNRIIESITRDLAHYRQSWEKRFEWLLKYCCFLLGARAWLTWRLPEPKSGAGGGSPPRVRFVWSTPSVDVHFFGAKKVNDRMRRLAGLRGLPADADAADINNLAATRLRLAIDARRLAASVEDEAERAKLLTAASEDRDAAYAQLNDGKERYPRHLVFRFNAIQWPMMWSVLHNEARDTTQWRNELEELVHDEPELTFEPKGFDLGTQVNSHHDRVFPYFRYSQTVLARAVAQTTGIQPALWGTPRTIVKAALVGYIGWTWHMENRAIDAARHFKLSLDIFGENQPLSHLYLEVLRAIAGGDSREADDAAKESVDAFLRCVRLYPVTLLTELSGMATLIKRAGRDEILPELLSDWYRFAATLHPLTFDSTIPRGCTSAIFDLTKTYGTLVDDEAMSRVSALAQRRP